MIPTILKVFNKQPVARPDSMEGPDWNLAIVKQLLERQGGTINVKSKINEGSSFSFVLSFKKRIQKFKVHHRFPNRT
jgi:two-component system CheB/CheR fusion protein